MGLFKKKARAEPSTNQPEVQVSDQLLKAMLDNSDATREKTMQIPSVSGCVDLIARTVANIPIKLYKKENGKVIEVKGDRRVYLLNEETGDTLDAKQMKQAIVRDYYLGSGGNIYVNWEGNSVESLHYVFCDYVAIAPNADVIFKDYAILVQGRSYYPYQFIRILRNTIDGFYGESIVHENSRMISASYNTLTYEENLVKTGGNKKGFIKSTKRLTQAAIDALKDAWARLYQNNTENVVILNDGLEFQEASNTSVEMQLNENKKTNGNEFCRIFNVPPSILDGGLKEDDEKALIKYCINNMLGELMTALNKSLLLESEKGTYYFAADMYELTKGDTDKRYGAYETALNSGWMQVDEVREKENMEPLGLDFVKLGLQDVLYNPKTKQIYTPNTGKSAIVEEGGEQDWQESQLKNQEEANQ